ncbi:hypothetical protein ACFV4S_15640, partial [Streptomyces sp. NPDC059742]
TRALSLRRKPRASMAGWSPRAGWGGTPRPPFYPPRTRLRPTPPRGPPDGAARLLYEFVDGMRDFSPPLEMDLTPLSATVFAASGAGPSFSGDWMPVVFATLVDGTPCCYIGMRCAPKADAG